jgi:hypothetical protein
MMFMEISLEAGQASPVDKVPGCGLGVPVIPAAHRRYTAPKSDLAGVAALLVADQFHIALQTILDFAGITA